MTTCNDDNVKVKLSGLICPAFHRIYRLFKQGEYTHYWLCGGRGSGKSTFAAICLVLSVMRNDENAIVFRKTENKLRESVFEQVKWVIAMLGVEAYWKEHVSLMELTYVPTGKRILFRGMGDAARLKSIKASSGRFSFVWFEETDEFSGMGEIRTVLQSLLRGGGRFSVFYSYNPPAYAAHWINAEAIASRKDKYVHTSSYLDVPKEWLGDIFISEAEYLKKSDFLRYQNEYLGETGRTGSEVFRNVTVRSVEDGELEGFDNIKRGMDFGFAVDPFAYVCLQYDKKHRRIIIFDEIYEYGLSNSRAAEMIWNENSGNGLICADSSEPKSISEFRSYGLRVEGAKKGKDSVYYGIKFLQDLGGIIIDGDRCPNAAREFLCYSYSLGKSGAFTGYSEKDNHIIDAVRYALEGELCGKVAKVRDRRQFLGAL